MEDPVGALLILSLMVAIVSFVAVSATSDQVLGSKPFEGTTQDGQRISGTILDVGTPEKPRRYILTEEKLWRITEKGEWKEQTSNYRNRLVKKLEEWRELTSVKEVVEKESSEEQ